MARILIVDDDRQVRETLRAILAPTRHELVEAGNGRQALQALAFQLADLMIADIMMPELDGIGLILEARKRYPSLRMLCISGGGRNIDMDFLPAAEKLGAHMVLAKPFMPKQLLAAVEALLRGAGAAAGENE